MKSEIMVIVGPTASGKSEFAVRLARKFKGEIISADSRQVYRGLDIGTGKVAGRWQGKTFFYKKIPHHCIDFVSPKKQYSVAAYQNCAQTALQSIRSRYKVVILTGGTGFWIDAVVYNLALPDVPPNSKLRKYLSKKSPKELLTLLRKLDPRRARTIEQKNPRRLIRAIEIAKALGKVPEIRQKRPFAALWIGLKPKNLEAQIKKRVQKMIRQGLARETKKLLSQGISKKRIREFGFEYCLALDFLEKKISRKELAENLIQETLRYARRQMTWFKRKKEIRWISVPSPHST